MLIHWQRAADPDSGNAELVSKNTQHNLIYFILEKLKLKFVLSGSVAFHVDMAFWFYPGTWTPIFLLFAVALVATDGEFTADDGAGNLIGGGEEFETSSDAPAEEVRARKMQNTTT